MASCSEVNEAPHQVFVRFLGKNRAVNIEKGWSILQLKQHLGQISGHKHEELKVIFAGHVLPDDLTLEKCGLGQRSVVHVLVSISDGANDKKQSKSKNAEAAETQNFTSNSGEKKKSRFYVYCKSTCKKAQPGKLRVRCNGCKDEAFTLSRDPDGWQDVLVRERIDGSCYECSCNKAEFFFKCAGHEGFGDVRDEATPLCHVMSNTLDSHCLGCLDIQDPILTFPCDDKHSMCLPCFAIFCQSKIKERQLSLVEHPKHIGYTLSCPGGSDSCKNAFVEDVHHFRVAGDEVYEQYQRFATEDLVLQSGGILCPGRGCGSGIFPGDGVRRILCEKQTGGCGLVFCRNCLGEYHHGDCKRQDQDAVIVTTNYRNLVENALKTRRETEKSLLKIRETTKMCPGCRSPTEKAGGCNHMTCQRCKYQWCWNCEIQWNSNCQGDHWFRLL